MAVSGSLWTILLPGTKNKATIEVLAEHLGEETVRETTTYSPSASLVTDFTQSIGDAIDQYRFDRIPKPKGKTAESLH